MSNNILYCWNKDLPEYLELEEKAQLLRKAYEIGIAGLKKELEQAEERFKEKRNKARENAKFTYSVSSSYKEDCKYYIITRKIIDPLIGDTEFNKDITYCSFRIVNSVVIINGGGHMFQNVQNGDTIQMTDIDQLHAGEVPDIFKNTPKIDKGLYSLGS